MKFRKKPIVIEAYQTDKELIIQTLEGTLTCSTRRLGYYRHKRRTISMQARCV